jgi:hypothetical protein
VSDHAVRVRDGADDRRLDRRHQHGLNPPLITLLVGISLTASFLSLPLWWYVLQGVLKRGLHVMTEMPPKPPSDLIS